MLLFRNILVFLLTSFVSSHLFSQQTSTIEGLDLEPNRFVSEIAYELSRSINTETRDDYQGKLGLGLSYRANYFAPEETFKLNLVLDQFFSKKNKDNEEMNLRDLMFERIQAIRGFDFLEEQSLSYQIGIGNSEASQSNSMVASYALKYSYLISIQKLLLAQYQRITYVHFQKEFNSEGAVNSPWRYRFLQSANYSLSHKASVHFDFVYDLGQSFQSVLRDAISTAFRVSYKLNDTYLFGFGVGNALMSLKGADGAGDDIKLFDEKSASVFVSLGAVY